MVLGATTISTAVMAVVVCGVAPGGFRYGCASGRFRRRRRPPAACTARRSRSFRRGIPSEPRPIRSREETPHQVLQLALQDERKKSALLAEQLRAVMDSSQKASAAADSAQREQRKSMAKVLENMDPTSAARILNDFPDGDVKTCLLTMKKRQAAKILAALQPDRAARIMR